MDSGKTALERAFQLAASGKCLCLEDIHQQLKREGYLTSQIEGPVLKKQLATIIRHSIGQTN